MRLAGKYAKANGGALGIVLVLAACSYDFDGLVAQTGGSGAAGSGGASSGGSSGAAGTMEGGTTGGTAGQAGSGGSAGADGDSGTAGKGGAAGTAGSGGTSGAAGKGGSAGTSGKGGNAGTSDAAIDRGIVDVRAEAAFDCAAVNGTPYQGHCYYPSSGTTNWDTANMTACAAPSHLVVITTAGEQGVVASILPNSDRWIGLRKTLPANQESSFKWVTNEALSFKQWDVYETGMSEPNFSGDCVRIAATNNWGDSPCNGMYAAICERE